MTAVMDANVTAEHIFCCSRGIHPRRERERVLRVIDRNG